MCVCVCVCGGGIMIHFPCDSLPGGGGVADKNMVRGQIGAK